MTARGRGKIVNTASLLSFQGGVNVPGYTASKSAVAGLTKALANEWAPLGVNVNAVAPGYVATANTYDLRQDGARSQAILDRIPAGRWAQASDIAGAVLFLCSHAADYIHGVILPVDVDGWLDDQRQRHRPVAAGRGGATSEAVSPGPGCSGATSCLGRRGRP